jgi:HKD family nuclease
MLHPKGNRLNYGDLLSPPAGFKLIRAVGTTYSLDLYALLALPVAMFYQKSLDGDFKQNRYDVLDAIQKSKERIDLFYQRGKSKAPKNYNSLLAFIDDCGIEVRPPIYASSFHPKMWCLRFESKDEVVYRLIIMSRNLTFDRSWDVSCYMDGRVTKSTNADNQKLSSYLKYFYKQADRQYDEQFFDDFEKVQFEVPAGFSSIGIHPIQYFDPNAINLKNPLENLFWDKLMIVSPFVDKSTISSLTNKSKHIYLFSRKEELDKVDEDALKGLQVFQFNPLIAEGESALDSDTLITSTQNLHAKLYVGLKEKETTWLLGSANCTLPAFERNTEILLSLKSDSPDSGFNRMFSSLTSDETKLFEPYCRSELDTDEIEEGLQQKLRKFLFELTEQNISGKVVSRLDQENYDVQLRWDLKSIEDDGFKLFVRPIHVKGMEEPLMVGQMNTWKVENIPLTKLSPFIVVRIVHSKVTYAETLLKIDIELPEERTDAIFNDLINNKKRFQEYLRFLLAPDELKGDFEIPLDTNPDDQPSGNGIATSTGFNSPIYEHLLVAASRNPSKLKEIDRVVQRIKRIEPEIVADFELIWEVFKTFADE